MITLSASGSSVIFTFDGNSTYLNDGTITVPKNSLALIVDESDMVTFRKAASNDIFVSANIAEFGMTKAELESWYKANMVGSTGGGGGTDTGTVQTMIDQSISGKMDTSAYTVDSSVNSASTNPVQNQALYNELRTTKSTTAKTSIALSTGVIPTGVTQLELTRDVDEEWSIFYFSDRNNHNVGQINVYMNQVTNMFNGSSTSLSGNTIIITYPSTIDVASVSQQVGTATWTLEAITNIDEIISLKDEIISLKEDVYTTGQTSGATEIANALSAKVDADFDNSLGFDTNDDLGVYAEGKSEEIVFNTASSKVKEYTFPSVYTNGSNNLYKVQNVTINLNQSFSGTVSPTKAIGVKYYANNDDGLKECWWDYSNGAFTINRDYSANNSVRLFYNSSEYKIDLYRQGTNLKTIVTIMVGGDYYIASSSNPTEADCYISYIKTNTPVKKLQSVLDEKQRKLTPGDGIELDYSGNISANIKVTGDTYTNVLNSESATTGFFFDDIKNVDMWLNQSYTGTPSDGWYTISVRNLNFSYDYYLYENDTFTLVSGYAGSTINYDSSTGKVTITCPSGISYIQNLWKFAPKDDLTNADCFIGLVSYTSNVYTIQDAIDNKQDTLIAGENITISGNVISATGGGGGSSYTAGDGIDITNDVISVTGKVDTSDVTTAVTSGSTDVVTSGGVYAKMGGMTIVKITESDYQSLSVKDPDTLYVVIPDTTNP